MNKAILVIDMPKNCNECKIRFDDEYSNWCPYDNPEPNGVWKYVKKGAKPDWCPLKPAPEEQEIWYGDDSSDWSKGYNSCLHEIIGE
jgi:predicted Fe-S protein YdhL (DUF1289 family)